MITTPYVLDREASRAVDRAATAEFGIPSIVLMENAAIALAREAIDMVGATRSSIVIVCGTGNNGGDGWALARHLANADQRPLVAALGEPTPDTDAAVNWSVVMRMRIEVIDVDRVADADSALVVDAIFGTGLSRPVSGPSADAIGVINESGRPVLAVDLPSGLSADDGSPLGVAVRASRTVTFVGIKPGFLEPAAHPYLGEVVVAGIGAPVALTRRFGRPLPADAAAPILRVPA